MATTDLAPPHVTAPALTPRAEAAFRVVTTISVGILAILAAVLSYAGLKTLAINAAISPDLAWIFPIVVDGLTFVGSIGVVYAVLTRTPSWYPWFLTLLGVGVSVTGNIAVSPVDPISRMVHAAPPIVLALSLEALLRVYRARAHSLLTEKASKKKSRRKREDRMPAPTPQAVRRPVPVQTRQEVDAFATASPSRPAAARENREPATVQPLHAVHQENQPPPARVQIRALLDTEPEITGADAARRLNIDPSHARKLLRAERADDVRDDEQDEQTARSPQADLFA